MIRIKDSDLEITHTKGSGPGGQHKNKRQTGVRVVHLPTGIAVVATDSRSQAANLEAAKERLREKLEKKFHRPKKRRPTKPTRSSKERRLTDKKRRSENKKSRSAGWND